MIETATYTSPKTAWLGSFPEHWKVLRIKNLFREIDARSETGNEELLSVSHYTGVSPRRDSLENDDDNLTNAASLVGYKKVTAGDLVSNIMLAWNGSLGIAPCNGITSPAYCVYRCLPGNNPEYFGYLFSTALFKAEFRRNSTGIIDSRLRLYSDKFFSIFSFVPPKDEQDKIVEYIKFQSEKIDRFIAAKLRFIEYLNEQKQTIIDDAVSHKSEGWVSKRLKFIADVCLSSVDKHTKEDEIPIRLCNYNDVYKNDFITNDMELMEATATEAEINKFKLFKGDIIITKDSETSDDIGVPAIVAEELENIICGYHLAIIKADETQILNEFLFRAFQSKDNNLYFEINSTGVTRVGLGLNYIKGVRISFPKDLDIQRQIVNYINTETQSIYKAIAKAEREIELINEYQESMIANAVMGYIK